MNLGGEISLVGLIFVVLAAFFWGMGSIIVKKLGRANMISLVVWGSLVAWPPLLAVSFLIEGPEHILSLLQNLQWSWVGPVLYIAYLATIFGFGAWNWLIQRHPVSSIAPFTLLVPVVAIVCSSYYLGEPLQTWKIMAGALVLGGVCVNLVGPRIYRAFQKDLA